jgi:hypothetical protein
MTPQIIYRLLLMLCVAWPGVFPAMGWTADAGKQYFQWVDKEGNVHYTEFLPPEQASQGSKKINAKGMTVETLAGAKTAELRAQENRLKILHADLVRIVGEQAEHDQTLLRTFRSVDDIQQTLQGKLTALNSLIRVVQTNRERQAAQLDTLQKKAANLERDGKSVPDKLKAEIEASQKLVADYEQKARQHEEQKQRFRVAADVDAAQLTTLLGHQGRNSLTALLLRLKEMTLPPGKPPDLLVAAIPCKDGACAAAWKKARIFVEQHTPHPHTTTGTVLFSADPVPEQPLGLLVGQVKEGQDPVIFMEVLCEHSAMKQEQCAGADAQGLREGFRMTLLPESL